MPVTRILHLPSWLLARATLRAHEILQHRFAEYGLRSLHYRMMAAIDEHGPLSQVDLGRHLELDRKDVAVTLDALSERGLAQRDADPSDGRRKIVTLTSAGVSLLPALELALSAAQEEILSPLAPEESTVLVALLEKLGPVREREDDRP